MRFPSKLFFLLALTPWLTHTYAMDPSLLDNPRYQQLAHNPVHARHVQWSSYPPVLSASLISETDFSQMVLTKKPQLSDHVGFETPLEGLQVRVWNILAPGAPSGYDYFACANEVKYGQTRIYDQMALISKWHGQPNAVTLLQEVTPHVYGLLLPYLKTINPLIQGDFETCTTGTNPFGVATFWNSGFVTATRIYANPTLSRSLMHKFSWPNLKNEVYVGNTHCAYGVWTANQASNASIIKNMLDLAPLSATIFVGGDLNHSALSLAPSLPSCHVCEFTNTSLAFTPGVYTPGFKTNTTDGFFVRFAVPVPQTTTSIVPASPQNAASPSYSLPNASLWAETPPLAPIIVSEEVIKTDIKPIAPLQSFSSAPDGTLTITMNSNPNMLDQLKSDPFPVTPNDFIALSYKVKVEAGGTMTLGFLNTQGNGLYEPSLTFGDGEYTGTHETKVPAGETQASLVVRHNHWSPSGQTTFTLSPSVVRYKKSAK